MKVMNQKIMWLYDHMCKRLLGNSWNLPLEDDNVEHIEVGQIEALMMQVFKKTAADLMAEYDDQLPGVRVLLKILLTFRSFENMLKSRSFDDQHVIMDWRETRSLAKLYIDAYYTTPDEQQGRPGDLDVSGMYFADRGPALKLTSEYGARGTVTHVEEPSSSFYFGDMEFNPKAPEETTIEVIVKTNSRQSGQSRLAHAIARSIARLGYSNVTLTSFQEPGWENALFEQAIPEMEEALKKVCIHVDDVAHPNVPRLTYDILPPVEPRSIKVVHKDGKPSTGEIKPEKDRVLDSLIKMMGYGQAVEIIKALTEKDNKYGPQFAIIRMQPNEPFFVLLGRDPQAPDLVEAWASDRLQMEEGNPKATQAFEIAAMMRAYKDANPDVGMPAVLYNNFLENAELIQLSPRNRKYTAEEILKMAMTVTEAAVDAEVDLNVSNNTCFVHPSVINPVEQQLGHVSKIAQNADKNVLIMLMEDGRPKQIWGSFDTALTYFGHEAMQDIEYFAPGEYPESEDQESFVVPG